MKFFPPAYINGRNVMRATQNKSIFLLIRTCGRAVNWILTVNDTNRTNNMCESWNHSFNHLVGRANPSFRTVLQALQRDQSLAAVTILRKQRGQLPVKRAKRSMTELQKHLAFLCKERRDDTTSLPDCLLAVGHCIRHRWLYRTVLDLLIKFELATVFGH